MVSIASVVRVVCDPPSNVSIWSSWSYENYLRRLAWSGRSVRSYWNKASVGKRILTRLSSFSCFSKTNTCLSTCSNSSWTFCAIDSSKPPAISRHSFSWNTTKKCWKVRRDIPTFSLGMRDDIICWFPPPSVCLKQCYINSDPTSARFFFGRHPGYQSFFSFHACGDWVQRRFFGVGLSRHVFVLKSNLSFSLFVERKARDTQMTTRARWERHALVSRARAFPSLNLNIKRDCWQSTWRNGKTGNNIVQLVCNDAAKQVSRFTTHESNLWCSN